MIWLDDRGSFLALFYSRFFSRRGFSVVWGTAGGGRRGELYERLHVYVVWGFGGYLIGILALQQFGCRLLQWISLVPGKYGSWFSLKLQEIGKYRKDTRLNLEDWITYEENTKVLFFLFFLQHHVSTVKLERNDMMKNDQREVEDQKPLNSMMRVWFSAMKRKRETANVEWCATEKKRSGKRGQEGVG